MLYEDMDTYCKVFVDTDIQREDLVHTIARILNGAADQWNISTDVCDIDVIKNDEFDEEKVKKESDGFLYSRYYLDIESLEDTVTTSYISEITKLVMNLRKINAKVVPACDFEDALPKTSIS